MLKRTLVAVTCLAMAALACAQAETKSFSASSKINVEFQESPQGQESGKVSMQTSAVHSFSLTPEQEQAITQSGATITINGFDVGASFSLSEDPKFVAGSKSAKIKRIYNEESTQGSTDISAKWGKGQMTVSIKNKLSGSGDTGISAEKYTKLRAPGHPEATDQFSTEVTGPVSFSASGYVSFDMKQSTSSFVNPDGTTGSKISIQGKTVSLVDEPLTD